MYCKNCGKEISDESSACVHCGAITGSPMPGAKSNPAPAAAPVNDPNEPANVGLIILSVMVPLAGVVLGILQLNDGKKRAGKAYLMAAIITLGVSFLLVALFFLAFFLIFLNT